ncbi:MAG: PIN domain-containing protein [Alphaproteobacteria bacterium]
MIAADSSSIVAYLAGESAEDVDQVAAAVDAETLVLPPAVITEILSDAKSSADVESFIDGLPLLAPKKGYWQRAGLARRLVKKHGKRALLGDALIAQTCIDHDVALITRDEDFRHFAKHCGLRLV